MRDYVHICDLAQAHVLALGRLLQGASEKGVSEAYNLGNGHGFSVREVIEVVRQVTGASIPVVEGDRRPGDPAILVADAAFAGRELSWRPSFYQLEKIVETAGAWH